MSCYVESHHDLNAIPTVNPKNECNAMRCLQMNEMVTTCHIRHISMPVDQTINEIYMQCNNLLNESNSIP